MGDRRAWTEEAVLAKTKTKTKKPGFGAFLATRMGFWSSALVLCGMGLFYGIMLSQDEELERKEMARREKLIQERVEKELRKQGDH